jgi:hypothetical protein
VDCSSEIEFDRIRLVCAEGISRFDCVTIHRGAVESRHVDSGVDTLGQHATVGLGEVDDFGATAERQRVNRLPCFVGVGQRAKLFAAHG